MGNVLGSPLICTCCSLLAFKRNSGGEAINGTAVDWSSAAVLTQVCTANGLLLGFEMFSDTLRLSLSNTTRVLLIVNAAWLSATHVVKTQNSAQEKIPHLTRSGYLLKPNIIKRTLYRNVACKQRAIRPVALQLARVIS
ncbi:hypothetical protein EMIT0P258_40142 [Pseudomonas sp. IT-P258]